ncbi:uncharacterized protein Tco025E_08959, partial [Trypanosoma conorhini]
SSQEPAISSFDLSLDFGGGSLFFFSFSFLGGAVYRRPGQLYLISRPTAARAEVRRHLSRRGFCSKLVEYSPLAVRTNTQSASNASTVCGSNTSGGPFVT